LCVWAECRHGRKGSVDALARRLLVATGQLPDPRPPVQQPGLPKDTGQRRGLAVADENRGICWLWKLGPGSGRCGLRNADEVVMLAALGWHLDVEQGHGRRCWRLPRPSS